MSPRSPIAVVLASCAMTLAAGCASLDPQVPKVVAATPSRTVALAQGDTLVVALPTTAGDRGRWVAKPSDATVLQEVGVVDLLPQTVAPGTVGNGNDNVYRFRAAGVGTASVDLVWTPADTPAPASTAAPVHVDVAVGPRPGRYAEAWATKSR